MTQFRELLSNPCLLSSVIKILSRGPGVYFLLNLFGSSLCKPLLVMLPTFYIFFLENSNDKFIIYDIDITVSILLRDHKRCITRVIACLGGVYPLVLSRVLLGVPPVQSGVSIVLFVLVPLACPSVPREWQGEDTPVLPGGSPCSDQGIPLSLLVNSHTPVII